MSIVFDYLQRRLAESGSAYWKSNSFDIRLANKTDKEIDPSAMDYTLSNVIEVTGINYLPKKSSNNVVIQTDTGKIVYTFDDAIWESSSISADGVLITNGQYPLIFIDFGYRRLSENDLFEIQWGEDGLIYLETSNETVSNTSTSTSNGSSTTSTGIETGKNLGSGEGLYAGVNGKTINFKTLVSDKWIVINSTDEEVTLKLNQDFIVQGDNVKLEKNADGSITINAIVKDNSNPVVVPNEIEKKLNDHIGDTVIHVTQADKDKWNDGGVSSWNDLEDKPTTVSGFGITDVYTKTEVDVHTNDTVIHVTQEDKDKWNTVDVDYVYYVGNVGDTTVTLAHNLNTEDYVVDYVDMETKSNLVLVAEQNNNTLFIDDLSPLSMNQQLKVILRMLNKKYSDSPPTIFSLVMLDVSEVSMLCVDGSDGKNNSFYLEAIFSDGYNHQTSATWTSLDPTIATVDSYGYVRGVSNGGEILGKDVTISCSWGGVVKSCLFTVYETMPSADVEGAGLWLCKGGSGGRIVGSTTHLVTFATNVAAPSSVNCRSIIKSYVGPNNTRSLDNYSNLSGTSFVSCVASENSVGGKAIAYKISVASGSLARYTYYTFGPNKTPNTLLKMDFGIDSSGYRYNGTTYNPIDIHSAEYFVAATSQHAIYNYQYKLILDSESNSAKTESQLAIKSNCTRLYIHQNYIRYTDQGSYVNRTVIPNIGTLGASYNLEANNVPALWFGI